jgi:hypothetical protein
MSFLRDGPFAVAVGAASQPVVDGGEGGVSLREIGRFRDQGLQRLARLVRIAGGQVEDGQLIANARIVGARLEGALEVAARLDVVLILLRQHAQVQVRYEFVRIQGEFLFEGRTRAVDLSHREQQSRPERACAPAAGC